MHKYRAMKSPGTLLSDSNCGRMTGNFGGAEPTSFSRSLSILRNSIWSHFTSLVRMGLKWTRLLQSEPTLCWMWLSERT